MDMGHRVIMPSFDVSDQYRATYAYRSEDQIAARDRYGQMLVEDVRKNHRHSRLDLVLTYYNSFQISLNTVHELRSIGPVVINYSCNNAHQFDEVRDIAPHFDFCIVPERQALDKYRAVGARPLHIQMAANPDFYKPYPLSRRYDATFIGQKYLNRPEYLSYLNKNGIDVRVWGPGWRPLTPFWDGENIVRFLRYLPGRFILRRSQLRKWKGFLRQDPYALPEKSYGRMLSDIEMLKIFSMSKISLNFSEVKDQVTGEIKRHIRLRDFEGPMSGAFYITGYQEELAEYYEIGKEIICYDTREDLLDKVKYYLSNPTERDRISKAGFERARRDHTWQRRFEVLFKQVGLN